MDGQVIAVVEEGMNLIIVKKKWNWTKVRVFEKQGWIASKLIKSEVQNLK
jgi:SH3-like domain-containing protein